MLAGFARSPDRVRIVSHAARSSKPHPALRATFSLTRRRGTVLAPSPSPYRVANKGETLQPPRMSRIMSVALDDLNPEQRAAVAHGPTSLLVIAGAGSGKTKTLATRVAHLVANGADPSRILLLTFSRRAASEMIARVGKALGGDVRIAWAGTFHAIGARLLR